MDQDNKFEDEKDMIHEVVIIGAGIAGLAAALALKRVGIKSLVLERSSELRAFGTALHIFQNGWRALEVLGVADKLDKPYQDFQLYHKLYYHSCMNQLHSYSFIFYFFLTFMFVDSLQSYRKHHKFGDWS